jgi:hypothetical protein
MKAGLVTTKYATTTNRINKTASQAKVRGQLRRFFCSLKTIVVPAIKVKHANSFAPALRAQYNSSLPESQPKGWTMPHLKYSTQNQHNCCIETRTSRILNFSQIDNFVFRLSAVQILLTA